MSELFPLKFYAMVHNFLLFLNKYYINIEYFMLKAETKLLKNYFMYLLNG
jgi:hypothetical protein